MTMTKAKRMNYIVAADVCRNMQRVFSEKARRSGGAVRELWSHHASGAGSCALELECLGGLTFDQIAARKRLRHAENTARGKER